MKSSKIFLLVLICVLVISLTGCTDRYYYSDSLEHYTEIVMSSNVGHSSFGIDRPSIFLPSQRFLLDFEYTSSIYRWYENDPGNFHAIYTTTSLLVLRYDEDVYWSAKEHMIANIPNAEGDTIYEYGDYKFYKNQNFFDQNDDESVTGSFFTMACYNDTKKILCFVGIYDDKPEETRFQYYEDLQNHFKEFIDYAYGRFYNFETHEVQEVVNPEIKSKW